MKKIYLNQLSERLLKDREMNSLRGGQFCSCSCYNPENSSVGSNVEGNYNMGDGSHSIKGCNQHIMVDGVVTYGFVTVEAIVYPQNP